MVKRVYNFNPGPAALPLPVLERAQAEMLDFAGTGMSVMEVSHRSKEYDAMHKEASALLRSLMGIPDDYKVLWVGGGASLQFYAAALNLYQQGRPMAYVNTGAWSAKAIKEAQNVGEVKVVSSSEDRNFSYIPKNVRFEEEFSYAHITGNNTIYGTEWQEWPQVPKDVPLVCDMSSHIMDRPIDVKRFGVIYAGAQKNLGPAGVTVVIVREDLLGRVPERAPTMLKWKTHADKDSLYNTPPCWNIYICKLALEWLEEIGGVQEIERRNRRKAKALYDTIDGSGGFYRGHAEKDSRSLMNVTFNLPTPELEAKCAEEAKQVGLVGLKGHRSVGGMRASIYNAVPEEAVAALVEFLKEFQEKNQ